MKMVFLQITAKPGLKFIGLGLANDKTKIQSPIKQTTWPKKLK